MSERLTDELLQEIEARVNAATKGPWSVPHFAEDDAQCNCRHVLCEGFMGSVADISVDNGKPIGQEGGNDCPPLEEAKSNARFIAHSREDILALLAEIRALREEVRLAQEHYGLPAKEQRSYPPPNLLENAS